jgi:hypothetical protein
MLVNKPEAAAELARLCTKGGRIGLMTWSADGRIASLFIVTKPYMSIPTAPPLSSLEWVTEIASNSLSARPSICISRRVLQCCAS